MTTATLEPSASRVSSVCSPEPSDSERSSTSTSTPKRRTISAQSAPLSVSATTSSPASAQTAEMAARTTLSSSQTTTVAMAVHPSRCRSAARLGGQVARGPAGYAVPFPKRDGGPAAMADVEIGIGKSGRRAYGFDDIAIVPSRRTRDPEEVDIAWEIDAFRFELPVMASPVRQRRVAGRGRRARPPRRPRRAPPRGAVDPLRRPGADPRGDRRAHARRRPPAGCRRSTPSRCSPTSSGQRIGELKAAGHTVAVACTPQRTLGHGARTSCGPSPTSSSSRAPSCRPSTCPASASRSTSRTSSATTRSRWSSAAAPRTRPPST